MRWQLLAPAVLTALIWIAALALFAGARGETPGQGATTENQLWWTPLAAVVWSGQALSLILTVWGFVGRSWPHLVLAAALSSILAISTVFVLTSLLTLFQLAAAVGMRLSVGRAGWAGLVSAAIVAWGLVYGRFLVPVWLGWCPPRCALF